MPSTATAPELPIIIGIAGALLLVVVARTLAPARELLVYAVGLGFTGFAYIPLALMQGAPASHLVRELVGALVFGLCAALGLRRWPLLLAAGWIAHVAWDLFLHHIHGPAFAPAWYAMFCVGFDLPIGGYVAGLRARPVRTASVTTLGSE